MKMVICQDLSEVFLPDLNGMVNRISDCAEPIIQLLRQIPKEFASTQDTSNCLGFALQVSTFRSFPRLCGDLILDLRS